MTTKKLIFVTAFILSTTLSSRAQAFKVIYEDTVTVNEVRYELIADIFMKDTTYYASVLPADDKWDDRDSKHYNGDIVINPYITYKDREYPVIRTSPNCFRGCTSLESVSFPETLGHIGDFTFADCGDLKITLPSKITSIGAFAFKNTHLPDNYNLANISYFENNALIGCDLKHVAIGPWDYKSGYNAFIGSYCFKDTDIEYVTFMEQEQEISMPIHTFAYCNIKELSLPKNAKVAIELVYKSPKIERIIFPETASMQFIADFQTVAPGIECCYADSWNLICECPNLKEIIALNNTPTKFYWHVEYELSVIDNYSTCVLKVPSGSEALYRADPVWGRFEKIEGFAPGEYSGIGEVPVVETETEAAPVYYNLQGIQVKEPVKGQLYIRKAGEETTKVIL